jgi:hypothetical protein
VRSTHYSVHSTQCAVRSEKPDSGRRGFLKTFTDTEPNCKKIKQLFRSKRSYSNILMFTDKFEQHTVDLKNMRILEI